MRWYNPMDAAFAARIHDKSKFANAAKIKPKKLGLNFESMKNVTPTKWNGCVNIQKVDHGR